MASVFVLHGLWLFVAKMAVLPFSGWAIYRYCRLARAWLAGRGALDHRLGIIAQEVLRSLAEHPESWHQLDPFCLALSHVPITYSHQAPLRLWLSNRKRMSMDGTIETTFTAIETLRLRVAVTNWLRDREITRVQQAIGAQPCLIQQDNDFDETVRQIIRSFQEHPERWRQMRHQVVYSRYPLGHVFDGQVRLWIANGVHYLEMEGRINRRFTAIEKAAIWSAYSSWCERTKALYQRNERRAARSVFN